MLEQWAVLLTVIFVLGIFHPTVYKITIIIDASEEVSSRLWAQERSQPPMPVVLVRLVQTDFNESYRKVFTSSLPVRWPHLETLTKTLTTGHLRPESVVMSVFFQEQTKAVNECPGKRSQQNSNKKYEGEIAQGDWNTRQRLNQPPYLSFKSAQDSSSVWP